MKARTGERLHPAVWPAALLILITVGRLPELFVVLAPLQLGKIAVLWAVAALVLGPRDAGDAPLFRQPLPKLMAAWFVIAAVSVLWSVWHAYSLSFLLGGLLINLILFFVIVRTTTNVRTLRFFTFVLLLSATLLGIEAILSVGASGTGRVSVGAAYDPNDLAMVLVMMLPLAVVFLFAMRGLGRGVMLLVCGTILVGILLTGSRGGVLGLLAVAGYLCFARLPRTDGSLGPRFHPAKFAVVGLGAIVLLVATPGAVWERIATMASLGDDYNVTGSTGRLAIWSRGIDAMIARPWGHGVAAFEAVEGGQGGRYKAAHNAWIEIGVELGVQGLVLLALVVVTAFGIARRVRRQAPRPPPEHWPQPIAFGLAGALIGYLVTGFFLSAAHAGVLFALLGVFAGLDNVARRAPVPDPAAEPSAPDGPMTGHSIRGDAVSRGQRPLAPVGGWRPISGTRSRRSSSARRSNS